jgi:deoxyguanosine kinase
MNISEKFPYIVIEGPIGSGKTTLAKRLANHLNARLMLENAEENPFLSRFYDDPERHALPTQLFFLFQRTEQLRQLNQPDLFGSGTIADYFLEKDPLFARLTLNDEEFALYRNIYQHLQLQITPPDLVIYPQTPVDVLLERVEKRGVSYERSISREYLVKLASSYSDFFHQYQAAPLLIVNNVHLDVTSNEDALNLLIERISHVRGQREFFNPNLE